MILLPAPRSAPASPYLLNGSSSLTRGLVFAWAGHLGLDLVGGGRPVNTNVSYGSMKGRRSWRFAGGPQGASDLNFGALATTGILGAGPSTYAFYTSLAAVNQVALACQNDANSAGAGWQIYCNPSSGLTAEWERSAGNVQIQVSGTFQTNVPATLVVTFDGGNLRNGSNIYLNGVLQAVTGGTNGSGTANTAAAQNLYLGRRRFNTALSHNGDIMVALLAKRIWTRGEISQFASDPYRFAQPERPIAYSFGGPAPAPTSGTIAATSVFSGTASFSSTVAGAIAATSAFSGTASSGSPLSGSISATSAFSGTLGVVGDVGDFDVIPCDCPVGTRIAFPAGTPGGVDVGDIDVVPCACGADLFGAFAIDGQTVRVVFSGAPTFRSPAGRDDAMNPANYTFSVDAGDARAPITTTVSPILVVGPTRYVGNGGLLAQRGVDVHVDRPLVEGIVYRVTVSNVTTAAGDDLEEGSSAPFGGVVLLLQRPRTQRGKPTTNVDIANDLSRGSWVGDDSGDLAPEDAQTGYRKRVFRRLMTPKDSFSFLKGYGVGQQLKGLARPALVAALKLDAEQQIMQEPETAKVSVNVSVSPLNYVTFSVRAWTRVGAFLEMTVRVAADGSATLVPPA